MKVGVGIFHDGLFLKDKFPQMRVNSRLDLRHLSRYCKIHSKRESLAALTHALLPFELQKKNVLSYKWEKDLSDEMVLYAALDALAAVLIFDKLLPLFHEKVRVSFTIHIFVQTAFFQISNLSLRAMKRIIIIKIQLK